jgi:hypothetical protein
VLKKASPVEHVAGNTVPVFAGFVVSALEASQLPVIVRLPVLVLCPYAHPIAAPTKANILRICYNPRIIVALKTALAGLMLCPMAQSRTAIWSGALTRMFPISPLSRPLGHPGAIVSPANAPVNVNVRSAEHVPAAISGKSSATELFRYVGTTVPSTAIVVCPPASTVTMPTPANSVLLLIQPRKSVPGVSQTPPAATHE